MRNTQHSPPRATMASSSVITAHRHRGRDTGDGAGRDTRSRQQPRRRGCNDSADDGRASAIS